MAERRPSISVALCTFNGGRFVREQLDSILAGSLLPDEIVVSDDRSTDDTLAIVKQVAEGTELPIRVIRNPTRGGVTANFESAIRATTGDIVVLADQDDVWQVDRLQIARDAFAADPALLVHHGDAQLIDESGAERSGTLFGVLGVRPADRFRVGDPAMFDRLLRRNLITGATMAFRRPLLDVALPFPSEWVHDEWLAILAADCSAVETAETALIGYRHHGANEIGAPDTSLRHKIARVVSPVAGRLKGLAVRAGLLADRLELNGSPAAHVTATRGKQAFEARRAALRRPRIRRIVPVLRLAATGGYSRYASRGRLDAIRDLLQPR